MLIHSCGLLSLLLYTAEIEAIASHGEMMGNEVNPLPHPPANFLERYKRQGDNELCYDPKDKGATYNGKRNYTIKFEPCLPWAQVNECPHHPYKEEDRFDNLEENYCRNPDDSAQPWCYIDIIGCKRNRCDVCNQESVVPNDKLETCKELKVKGFCTVDIGNAVKYCPSTCYVDLPQTANNKPYTEIECNPPATLIDGVIVGQPKPEYRLGDTVEFKCVVSDVVVRTTCLTSGHWSPVGFSCLAIPLDYTLYKDKFYGLVAGGETFDIFNAARQCGKIGGIIPTPRNMEENNVIDSVRNNKNVWLSANDVQREGVWANGEGDNITWNNWAKDEPNKNGEGEDCAVMSTNQTWSDNSCCDDKFAVVCAIPNMLQSNDKSCHDYLLDQCPNLLQSHPTMCKDFKSFSQRFCAKTCGFCGAENIHCPDYPTNNQTTPSEPHTSVGDVVRFDCTDDTFLYSGDKFRACTITGEYTGSDVKCKDVISSRVDDVGPKSLTQGKGTAYRGYVTTGNNKRMRIRHDGVIIAWEYYSHSSINNSFQVWRKTSMRYKYRLIGQNKLTTRSDGINDYRVLPSDRISVKKGDLIGIEPDEDGGVFSEYFNCDGKTSSHTELLVSATSSSKFHAGDVITMEGYSSCLKVYFRAKIAVTEQIPPSQIYTVGAEDLTQRQYQLAGGYAYLIDTENMRIKQNGEIEAWEYDASFTNLVIIFQVWRKSNDAYTLIGQNEFNKTHGVEYRYDVLVHQRIFVKTDDVIGAYVPEEATAFSQDCGLCDGVLVSSQLGLEKFVVGSTMKFNTEDVPYTIIPMRARIAVKP